ncbi:MAG: CDP-glycerol glycerophosphotransferase family protein, partial [Clostridia bacterium]|nr:CDP-glycerol glycerophosphotransferase family protein [Clostridia bacterium]
MKKIILILLKYGLRCIYFFMKLFTPVSDKAVFLSRQSDAPSENFLLLRDELQRVSPSTKCEFYCRLGLKSEMGLSYALLMLRQMKALAGAKYCFTESYCIPISVLRHKKHLRVVQIWHSMVAIKKFGWQTVDMPEGTSS